MGLSWISGWLRDRVEAMPAAAKNFMCWRVVVRQLFAAYERDAQGARQKPLAPAEFLDAVCHAFPAARVSDWRWLNGAWERELDGVRAKALLETPPARPSRSFTARPKAPRKK